jgi:hypothetical protein
MEKKVSKMEKIGGKWSKVVNTSSGRRKGE